MLYPITAMAVVLLALGALLGLTNLGVKKERLCPETARKSVHVGMGIICLFFPLLFESGMAVFALALIAVGSLLIVRVTKLKNTIGSSLFRVKRISIGELLFPLSVAWLFVLSDDAHVLYVISLLLLTLADTAGAIAGTRCGKKLYTTVAGVKSVEGSIAFFVTSMLCISVPLLIGTDIPLSTVVILSVAVGAFTTAVEGASGNGLDNMLIPIGSYFLLDHYLTLSNQELVLRVGILGVLLAVLLKTHRLHTLDGGAILTALIYAFASATLGGLPCLLACLLVMVRHVFQERLLPECKVASHSLGIVLAIAFPSLTWLTLGVRGYLSPNVAQFGYICSLAMIIAMLHSGTRKYLLKTSASLWVGVLLSLCVMSTSLLLEPLSGSFLWIALVTLACAPVLSWIYYQWKDSCEESDGLNWTKLSFLGLLGSSPILMLCL